MTDFVNCTNEELLNISSEISTKLVENGFEYGWHKKITYAGVIYILVNPAFSNLVKIGYADDVEKRMKTFNIVFVNKVNALLQSLHLNLFTLPFFPNLIAFEELQ